VAWAWRQLATSHGCVAIGDLADETGWSRRHLTVRFKEQVGLAPKRTARVLRFARAVRLLTAWGSGRIGHVAAECGYADHSHLSREFTRLAGCSPSELLGGAPAGLEGAKSASDLDRYQRRAFDG
jgi:AraC-like DNA-binding protein